MGNRSGKQKNASKAPRHHSGHRKVYQAQDNFVQNLVTEGDGGVDAPDGAVRTNDGDEDSIRPETGVGELKAHSARGKQAIESAVMDGSDAIISTIEDGAGQLNAHVIRDTERTESAEMDGIEAIIATIEAGAGELNAQVIRGTEHIESAVMDGSDAILATIEAGAGELNAHVIRGTEHIESAVMDGSDAIIATIEAGAGELKAHVIKWTGHIESTVMDGSDDIIATIEAGAWELKAHVIKGTEHIESAVMDGSEAIIATVEAGAGKLKAHVMKGTEHIESTVMDGIDIITGFVEEKKKEIRDVKTKNDGEDNDSQCKKIQSWLIEQYQAMCVVPVSMLDPDIDVPLERIYVPPSIKELKRGQGTTTTSRAGTDLSCYKELLHRDGNQVNTIYIQGDAGCGKTTFSTKLVLDWCKAHSENCASTEKQITSKATTRGKTSDPKYFSDLDTLREYTFLFFVPLRDYSGTMCNVSQMVEDAIKSNKLSWDESVWEHKCLVLTDAADEWYHPEISFPPPCDSACKCRKDRSMPWYLPRKNITNIITARPWKLANLSMSDTLTRMFEIIGVANYETLAENVINVLAEKDGISKNDQQRKHIDFFRKIEAQSLHNLIKTPAVCVQLVHQFYVGRLMEGSLCAIYINMLDMHIVLITVYVLLLNNVGSLTTDKQTSNTHAQSKQNETMERAMMMF